jgi:3-deoxy-D-manno-octulosonic-acid transferase
VPFFYALVSIVLFPFVWPFLLVHRKLRSGVGRRLGLYPADMLAGKTGPRVWLHGASAGDLLSLLPIYRELRRLRPDALFIISMMTNSGETIARTRFPEADVVTFLPYDVPGIVGRTMKALKPDVLVLEYTEIWPNLIRAALRRGVRLAISNGRLAEGNVRNYRLLFLLTGNLLRRFDLLLMREEAERERALALGAPTDRVHVTGNTKFDALLLSLSTRANEELPRAFAQKPDDWLWVAGSTHEGEEGILLDVFAQLRVDFPRLRLVVAPRYLERVQRIVALAESKGLEVTLRSAAQPRHAPVIILDTIGELIAAYRLARIVFVGGSFTRRGGQNILEPAACGKAVLFGPHMENFHDSVQVLIGRGGIQVNDAAHLRTVTHDLLAQPEKLLELGELAKGAVSGVSGASVRDAALIAGLLPPPAQSAGALP